MHSPAEEVGLMGQRLATRVQTALDRVPPAALVDLTRAIRRMATDRHLSYDREGVAETVQLLPCPLTMRNDQLAYTHYVSQTILECTKRLPDMYFEVPEVRDVLRVGPVEGEWLRECWTPGHRGTDAGLAPRGGRRPCESVPRGDARVDVVHRDAAVLDPLAYAAEGVDAGPMRTLFRQNRVVSSISAELDQKSIFELFTDPVLAERLFTVEE